MRRSVLFGFVLLSILVTLASFSLVTAQLAGPIAKNQSCSCSGTWSTDWGEMALHQSGHDVSGNYTHDQGRIVGTLSDDKMIGTWSEAPTYSPTHHDAGDMELILSDDCKSFSGNWRYGSEGGWSGSWRGTRIAGGSTIGQKESVTRWQGPESHKVGPYLVTFDLNTTEKLQVSEVEPRIYEDYRQYGLKLEDKAGKDCGWIGVNIYYKPISNSLNDSEADTEKYYKIMYGQVTVKWIVIDGHKGYEVTGIDGDNDLHWLAGCRLNDSVDLVIRGEKFWGIRDIEEELNSINIDEASKNDLAEAWNSKGLDLESQGKYDEATKAYDEAIRLNPNYAEAYYNKGNNLGLHQRKYDEALKAFDKAIQLNPNYAKAWYRKGLALSMQGKSDKAIKAYDEAIRLNPNYADAWVGKGIALNNPGKYEEAIKAFDEAIRLDPNNAIAYYGKGAVLKALGRTSEANAAKAKASELGYNGPG
jgi:tetratricopeptide (TPR) repeat protein